MTAPAGSHSGNPVPIIGSVAKMDMSALRSRWSGAERSCPEYPVTVAPSCRATGAQPRDDSAPERCSGAEWLLAMQQLAPETIRRRGEPLAGHGETIGHRWLVEQGQQGETTEDVSSAAGGAVCRQTEPARHGTSSQAEGAGGQPDVERARCDHPVHTEEQLQPRHPLVRQARAGQSGAGMMPSKATCRWRGPRRTALSRYGGGATTRGGLTSRRASSERAIWVSSRASGAPKQ